MCKLSVIVPIYNAEKYLRQCVDSIVKQNLDDIEVILVDDGSPDRCPEICDEYVSRYSYFKVIHKSNGGVSSARNVGITNSIGEYIVFIDSDDWWNPNVDMNKVVSYAFQNQQIDIIVFNIIHYIEGEGTYKRTENQLFSRIPTDSVENYYSFLVSNGNMQVAPINKIIKREFLAKNNLYFKDGIKSEDNEWMIRVLRCLSTVGVIDEPIYIYRYRRIGSLSNTIQRKNIEDLLDMIDASIQYTNTYSSERGNIELSYCSYLWFMTLGLLSKCSKADQTALKKRFQQCATVCKYGVSKKARISNITYRIFGYYLTIHILGGYLCLKKIFHLKMKKIKK